MVAKGVIAVFCHFALLAFISKSVDARAGWGITDDCTDSITNKEYDDGEVFVKDCTDICVCRRRYITCDDKFCPEIGNVQCPPHTVPIYQDQDITQFGVTCKCKVPVTCGDPTPS